MAFTITVLFPNVPDAKILHGASYASNQTTLDEVRGEKLVRNHFCPGPDGAQPPYTFGSVVVWENKEGVEKAFASPEVAEVMGDVPNFSNKEPVFLFGSQIEAPK
ncbi:Dimeric alpha-beta barrel [Penicillium expansum]|nr:Dimeric alpha-beta barrel [Penicillium expansum]